jgi:phospholipid/cholesterol/gamma-HCH transport system substrate-binding protein
LSVSGLSAGLKVGLVLLLALGAFAVGLTLIGGQGFTRGKSYTLSVVFDDASGLGVRTRVQIAGIVIGAVDRIELDEGARARVFLRIDQKYKLFKDAAVNKRSDSILGDFLLDVKPGTPSLGALKDGDEIATVVRQPGMNEILSSIGRITTDIQEITHSLRGVLATDQGKQDMKQVVEGLARITRNLEKIIATGGDKLDATLSNFSAFSKDMRELSAGERAEIKQILGNTREATDRAKQILDSVQQAVGPEQTGEVRDSIKSVKENLAKLDKTLTNLQSITAKVDGGQGTVGRLINDDTLIKNVEKASTNINALLSKANDLQVELSARSEIFIGNVDPKTTTVQGIQNTAYNPWAKTYFSIRILPRPDKWYGIELVDDPRGYSQLTKIQNCAGGYSPTGCDYSTGTSTSTLFPSTLQQITTQRVLKFSAYLAKRYGLVTARFGILENTGGVGLKLNLFNDDLVLSADAFEFANPLKEHPRVKLYADYRFLGHVFLTAGVDDLVNAPQESVDQPSRIYSGRDYFVGGGFFFTEEDFKVLLAGLPFFR